MLDVEKEFGGGPMFYKNSGFPKRMSPLERHVFPDKKKVYKKTLADVSGGSKEINYEVPSTTERPNYREGADLLLIKQINSKKPPS